MTTLCVSGYSLQGTSFHLFYQEQGTVKSEWCFALNLLGVWIRGCLERKLKGWLPSSEHNVLIKLFPKYLHFFLSTGLCCHLWLEKLLLQRVTARLYTYIKALSNCWELSHQWDTYITRSKLKKVHGRGVGKTSSRRKEWRISEPCLLGSTWPLSSWTQSNCD